MKRLCNKYYGFTLLELIIVITILVILATISFVSFSWYTTKSNDTNRISSLKNIEKWLLSLNIVSWNFPDPDDKINILATWSIIWYQWYAWINVLNIIKSSNAVDPIDNTFYTYSIDKTKTKFKLLWLLENQNISYISTAYADNNRYFYTLWDYNLWIFTDNNYKPVQDLVSSLEIIWNTGSYIWVINQNKIYYWNEISSVYTNSFSWITCRDILNKNPSLFWVNWYYNLTWTWIYNTYCDMSYDWWGWTLIYSALNDNNTVIRGDNIKLRSNTFFGSWIIKSLANYSSGVYITDNSWGYIQTKSTDTKVISNMRLWKTLNGGYWLWVDTTNSWTWTRVSYLTWVNTNQPYYDTITASSLDFLFIWCWWNTNWSHIWSNAWTSKVWKYLSNPLNIDIYIK